MNRFILIFLLLLLASTLSADNSYIKMKTALTKGVYHAKLGIKHTMIDEKEALKRGKKVQYIPHIVADINNKVIYDVWTSPLISSYPRFKFKFKYTGESTTVNLKVYNNNNHLEKRTFLLNDSSFTPIKKSSKSILEDVANLPSKVWKTSTVNEGINELYGEYTEFQKGIEVKVPDIISDKQYNHITIKSKLDLESIAVFAESYFQESLRAIFIIPKGGIIDYTFPIVITDVECEKHTKIIVVGKGRDSTMYKTTSSVRYCACEYACIDN